MQNSGFYAIVIIALIFAIYIFNNIDSFTVRKKVCNDIDNRCYSVVDKFSHPLDASKLLAYLNSFGIKFMRFLRNKYVFNGVPCKKRDIVLFLLSNYNPDTIIENAPIDDVNTSYVDDKGKVFALCLREKETGMNNLIPKEILEFVVLHEMSHMASVSYGHDTEFWTNFKFLLKEAKIAGLHNPIDYNTSPIRYCGLTVDYNPYHDNTLTEL